MSFTSIPKGWTPLRVSGNTAYYYDPVSDSVRTLYVRQTELVTTKKEFIQFENRRKIKEGYVPSLEVKRTRERTGESYFQLIKPGNFTQLENLTLPYNNKQTFGGRIIEYLGKGNFLIENSQTKTRVIVVDPSLRGATENKTKNAQDIININHLVPPGTKVEVRINLLNPTDTSGRAMGNVYSSPTQESIRTMQAKSQGKSSWQDAAEQFWDLPFMEKFQVTSYFTGSIISEVKKLLTTGKIDILKPFTGWMDLKPPSEILKVSGVTGFLADLVLDVGNFFTLGAGKGTKLILSSSARYGTRIVSLSMKGERKMQQLAKVWGSEFAARREMIHLIETSGSYTRRFVSKTGVKLIGTELEAVPGRLITKPFLAAKGRFIDLLNRVKRPIPETGKEPFAKSIMRNWKRFQTLPFPAYHVLNRVFGQFNAAIGETNLMRFYDSRRVMKYENLGIMEDKVIFTSIYGRKYKAKELQVLGRKCSWNKNIGIDDVSRDEWYDPTDMDKLWQPTLNRVARQERELRDGMFYDRLQKGDTPALAEAYANHYQVFYDPRALTAVEHRYIYPYVSFYTSFSRFALLHSEEAIRAPYKYTSISKLYSALQGRYSGEYTENGVTVNTMGFGGEGNEYNSDQNTNYTHLKQHERQANAFSSSSGYLYFQHPFDKDKVVRWKSPMSELPQIAAMLGDPKQIISSLYPIYNMPYEMIQNQRAWDKTHPSNDFPLYTIKSLFGRAYYSLPSTPIIGDPNIPLSEKLLKLGTGITIAKIDIPKTTVYDQMVELGFSKSYEQMSEVTQKKREGYLFTWDDENDVNDQKLKDYLSKHFKQKWIKYANIKRLDKSMELSNQGRTLSIQLDYNSITDKSFNTGKAYVQLDTGQRVTLLVDSPMGEDQLHILSGTYQQERGVTVRADIIKDVAFETPMHEAKDTWEDWDYLATSWYFTGFLAQNIRTRAATGRWYSQEWQEHGWGLLNPMMGYVDLAASIKRGTKEKKTVADSVTFLQMLKTITGQPILKPRVPVLPEDRYGVLGKRDQFNYIGKTPISSENTWEGGTLDIMATNALSDLMNLIVVGGSTVLTIGGNVVRLSSEGLEQLNTLQKAVKYDPKKAPLVMWQFKQMLVAHPEFIQGFGYYIRSTNIGIEIIPATTLAVAKNLASPYLSPITNAIATKQEAISLWFKSGYNTISGKFQSFFPKKTVQKGIITESLDTQRRNIQIEMNRIKVEKALLGLKARKELGEDAYYKMADWVERGKPIEPNSDLYQKWVNQIAEQIPILTEKELDMKLLTRSQILPDYATHLVTEGARIKFNWEKPSIWGTFGTIVDVGYWKHRKGELGETIKEVNARLHFQVLSMDYAKATGSHEAAQTARIWWVEGIQKLRSFGRKPTEIPFGVGKFWDTTLGYRKVNFPGMEDLVFLNKDAAEIEAVPEIAEYIKLKNPSYFKYALDKYDWITHFLKANILNYFLQFYTRNLISDVGTNVIKGVINPREYAVTYGKVIKAAEIRAYMKQNQVTYYEALSKLSTGYVFSWKDLTGKDKTKLLRFLKTNYNLNWVESATVEWYGDGRSIIVSLDTKYLLLRLSPENNRISIESGKDLIDSLVVRNENGFLNIYAIKDHLFKTPRYGMINDQDLIENAVGRGVIGQNYFEDKVGAGRYDLLGKRFRTFTTGLMDTTRLVLFKKLLEQGMDYDEAAKVVKIVLIDYNKPMGSFIPRVIMFPHWTFLNPVAQLTLMATHPSIIGYPKKVEIAMTDDYGKALKQRLPSYYDGTLTIDVSDLGLPGGETSLVALPISTSDLFNMLDLSAGTKHALFWEEARQNPDALRAFLRTENILPWVINGGGKATLNSRNEIVIEYMETGETITAAIENNGTKMMLYVNNGTGQMPLKSYNIAAVNNKKSIQFENHPVDRIMERTVWPWIVALAEGTDITGNDAINFLIGTRFQSELRDINNPTKEAWKKFMRFIGLPVIDISEPIKQEDKHERLYQARRKYLKMTTGCGY